MSKKVKYRFKEANPDPNIGKRGVKDIDTIPVEGAVEKVKRSTYVEKFAKVRDNGIYSRTVLNPEHRRLRTSLANSMGAEGKLNPGTFMLINRLTSIMAREELMTRYMATMLKRHNDPKLGRAAGIEDLTDAEYERWCETVDRLKAHEYLANNVQAKLLMTPISEVKYKKVSAEAEDLTSALQKRQGEHESTILEADTEGVEG